jgi:hypothetical protein
MKHKKTNRKNRKLYQPNILGLAVVFIAVAVVGYIMINNGSAASYLTGICETPSSRNLCMRVMPSGATDLWPRDIKGDIRQQFAVKYMGTANSTLCGTEDGIPGSTGVYTFKSSYNGTYLGAGRNANGVWWVGSQNSIDPFAEWAWGSDGTLKNCGDTLSAYDLTGIPRIGISSGHQLYANTMIVEQTWQQVHP